MSRSRRKVKKPRVPEPGCPYCDPEARRQIGLEQRRTCDTKHAKDQLKEGVFQSE